MAGNRIFYTARSGSIYVMEVDGDDVTEVAVNRFADDTGEFNATPAVSNGELFIRSSSTLYCVAE